MTLLTFSWLLDRGHFLFPFLSLLESVCLLAWLLPFCQSPHVVIYRVLLEAWFDHPLCSCSLGKFTLLQSPPSYMQMSFKLSLLTLTSHLNNRGRHLSGNPLCVLYTELLPVPGRPSPKCPTEILFISVGILPSSMKKTFISLAAHSL